MHVQALVAQAPVEGLDEGVFHGFARPNEVELHAALIGPVFERARHEFRAVIDGDRARRVRRRAEDAIEGRADRAARTSLEATSSIGLWRLH